MSDERIRNLEIEIQALKERNQRVESEKAWETSYVRTFALALVTYVIAAVVLCLIGVEIYLLVALMPTIGYMLSTLSLPVVRRWWIKTFLR